MEKMYEYLSLTMIIFGFISLLTGVFITYTIKALTNMFFFEDLFIGIIMFFLFIIGSMIVWIFGIKSRK
ncbi:MAG: hypothetical protein QW258_03645 [Thermoplasmata archaeon]